MPFSLIKKIETFLTTGAAETAPGNFIARMEESVYQPGEAFIEHTVRATTRLYGCPPLCCRGCFHCCHQLLMVSYAEGLYLYLKLKQANRLEELIPKAEARVAELREKLSERVISYANVDDAQQQFQDHIHEQNRLQLPCIFLAEDGACSIHPFRPLTCRDAHVFEGDPRDCKTLSTPVIRSIPLRETYNLIARNLSKKMWGKTGGGDILLILLEIHEQLKAQDLSPFFEDAA